MRRDHLRSLALMRSFIESAKAGGFTAGEAWEAAAVFVVRAAAANGITRDGVLALVGEYYDAVRAVPKESA